MNYFTFHKYKALKSIDMHLFDSIKQNSYELSRDLFEINRYIYDETIVQQIKDLNEILERLMCKQKETFKRIDEIRTEFAKNNEALHEADVEN